MSYTKLKNEFLNIPFSFTQGDTYRKNGFTPYLSLPEVFENKFTNTSGEKMQVRMMNFSDISRITLNFNADHQYVGDAKYNKLFIFGVRYYILEKGVCFIRGDTWNADILGWYEYSVMGIRPVVSLRANTKTKGIDLKGFWQLEI